MAKLFILSGHFKHPAEQDPWTRHRHNFSPYEDFQNQWKRLLKECYGANSASRVLSSDGLVRKIVNNFQYLSFSFSPRLLDELKKNSPNVYRRIQEADQESLARLGHGNAMAQPFHHTILPLASEKDRHLQVQWGIESFKVHFGRKPEGFALPECAVSLDTLDELVRQGIRFILLSPHQAEGIMPLGRGSWTSLEGGPAPSNRCFQIDRPGGSLVVFFHHPTLSRGMAQNHYLKSAEKLYEVVSALLQGEGPLLSASTEGELYGREEPFADMCLAALWEKCDHDFRLANYGLACELYPPQELVKLKKGENEEGTSEACIHGLSRWKTNCGCREDHAGDDQGWRTGLRTALTHLKEAADHLVDDNLQQLHINEADFRRELVNLWTEQTPTDRWLAQWGEGQWGEGDQALLLELALLSEHSQAMMDGWLWYFSDPTLVTARGGFLHALRVLEIASHHTADDWEFNFLQDLDSVILPSGLTASQYLKQELFPRKRDSHFPTALFLLDKLLRPQSHYTEEIGPFRLQELTKDFSQVAEQIFRFQGQISIQDALLARVHRFDYLLLEDLKEGVSLFLTPEHDPGPPQAFDLTRLPMGEREEIVQLMGGDLENQLSDEMSKLMSLLKKSMVYSRLLHIPPLPMTRALMELAATRRILAVPAGAWEDQNDQELSLIEGELAFVQEYGLVLDRPRLDQHFSRWIAAQVQDHLQFTQEHVVHYLDRLLHIVFHWGFQPDLTVAQALVYEALGAPAQGYLEELEAGNMEALKRLRSLIKLGGLFMIETSALKDRILEFH